MKAQRRLSGPEIRRIAAIAMLDAALVRRYLHGSGGLRPAQAAAIEEVLGALHGETPEPPQRERP